jgi:hypothetical protein
MASANNIKFQVGDEVFEPTGELLEQYLLDREMLLQAQADREAKPAAKAALLDRLGITEEEAALLLG